MFGYLSKIVGFCGITLGVVRCKCSISVQRVCVYLGLLAVGALLGLRGLRVINYLLKVRSVKCGKRALGRKILEHVGENRKEGKRNTRERTGMKQK